MNIKLKNKFLYFNNYKLRCASGKRGFTNNKKEGDGKTPKGSFKLLSIFYRKDRISKIKSVLRKRIIKKKTGWCDDPNSTSYNQLINFPFDESAEKFWIKKNIYDVIIILNYNLKPTMKKKGSAIFIHIARRDYLPTKGCIAINKRDMMLLISKIKTSTKIIVN